MTPEEVNVNLTDDDKWWDRVPDGAVKTRVGSNWVRFVKDHQAWVVDLWTDLAYGPVLADQAGLLIIRLIKLQETGVIRDH